MDNVQLQNLYCTNIIRGKNRMRQVRQVSLRAEKEKNYDMIYLSIYIFNRIWVDTRWQQYITHLHTNSTLTQPIQATKGPEEE
jgi:hypothetical protein